MGESAKAAAGAAVGAAGATLPAAGAGRAVQKVGANDKIAIGVIGCGGQGKADLGAFLRVPEIECLVSCVRV